MPRLVTHKRLTELFDYDDEKGVFIRKTTTGGRCAGTVAGTLNPDGYIKICIDRKQYLGHVLAWFYYYKRWPDDIIHIVNGINNDISIANLEMLDRKSLDQKRRIYVNNNSGVKGVQKTGRYWRATLNSSYLGSFKDKNSAIRARKIAEETRL